MSDVIELVLYELNYGKIRNTSMRESFYPEGQCPLTYGPVGCNKEDFLTHIRVRIELTCIPGGKATRQIHVYVQTQLQQMDTQPNTIESIVGTHVNQSVTTILYTVGKLTGKNPFSASSRAYSSDNAITCYNLRLTFVKAMDAVIDYTA